jgi:hypothetical protein
LEDFIFIEGNTPPGFEFDYEVSLFNLPEHRLLQAKENWISFHIVHQKKKLVAGGIHFHLADGIASSPARSPYGSLESSPNLESSVLFRFVEFMESTLRKKGIQKIVIKNPPTLYNPNLQTLLQVFLSNLHYKIINAEVGTLFHVGKPFAELSEDWEKRKYRQAQDEGLELCHVNITELELIYNFILACRTQKGYSSSMTYAAMEEVVRLFPERFLLTKINREGIMVAASICIRCNQKVLYHFYSDHSTSDKALNPTVFLIKRLYEYCLENKIAILDLGTSALDGVPNFGLLNFKLRLGATPTTKLTFEKTLTG